MDFQRPRTFSTLKNHLRKVPLTIFQLICKEKGIWDDKVSILISKFLDALESLKILEIDRFCFISSSDKFKLDELHGFSDSSIVSIARSCF